ncbi:MAG: pseudouridine synthase [Prevotella sp.]
MTMEFENEKNNENVEKQGVNREGMLPEGQQGRYQGYKPGRTPRPRIQTNRTYNNDRGGYRKNSNEEEGGFRPEGFGLGLQQPVNLRPQYRPRRNGNEDYAAGRGGYQARPQFRPRYNNDAENMGEEGSFSRPSSYGRYNANRGYNANNRGGYGNNNNRGGYAGNRGGYNANRGGYGNGNNAQGGFGAPRQGGFGGGYGNRQQQRGGYGNNNGRGFRQRPGSYDPNAKYSLKKRIEYKEENYDPNEPLRLNKFLANAGICSRREADEYIQAGVVTVNGVVVTELGTKVLRTDEVRFHDQPVSIEKKVYVLLNKPKDYVTTSDDPQQRKTVMDLVKNACPERIYPVGRLDRNTTGVLLLTNDGDMASKLTHPKYLKKKIYHVFLDKNITAHDLQQIRDGIMLEDGEIKADEVEYADPVDKKQVGISIHSGKNRIVRRIFESLGYRVNKLDRVLFAGLTKKNLRRGDWRYLTEEEVDKLRMGAYE